ncbi:Nucleoside-diphosphate-sugar epimerase [Ruminococcaceae bacterium YRB3002]|nr:Nucleoside-diphosphate-sugar epimerase [Ruminococcaceae bacterium YRB3002]
MKILVIGGTRFFGRPMVRSLLFAGHEVTVATRGHTTVPYKGDLKAVVADRTDPEAVRNAFAQDYFDVVIDKVAYASNDVKSLVENVRFKRYVLMSTCAVYGVVHPDIKEEEFDASGYDLKWINRSEDYAEGKRQAECAALHLIDPGKLVIIRYPVVTGENDYTGRLLFYVDHIIHGRPMHIDNLDSQIPFIHEREAGIFISHIAPLSVTGAMNGCSSGTISPREIINYIEKKTGRKAILSVDGDEAPYNGIIGVQSFNTDRAESTGFEFSNVHDWIYNLIDFLCYV